jgi:hypothetical protein
LGFHNSIHLLHGCLILVQIKKKCQYKKSQTLSIYIGKTIIKKLKVRVINQTNDDGYLISPTELWTAWKLKNDANTKRYTLALPASNWQPIGPIQNAATNSTIARGRVNIVHVDPNNSNIIYFGTPAGGIWKSIDSGTNWLPLSDQLPQIGVSGIAVDYANSNIIYITTGDKDATDTYSIGVMKSIDGGLTWATTGLAFTNTSTTAGDIVMHPTNSQILWCATSVGLYRTINGGTTWTVSQTGDFAQGSIRLKPGNPSTVYAVSDFIDQLILALLLLQLLQVCLLHQEECYSMLQLQMPSMFMY